MQKYWKKILIGLGLSALGLAIFRSLRIINAYNELQNTLPSHLENNFGEKPEINYKFILLLFLVQRISLQIRVSEDLLTKRDEIIRVVKSYLINFYPPLTKGKLDIGVEEKSD